MLWQACKPDTPRVRAKLDEPTVSMYVHVCLCVHVCVCLSQVREVLSAAHKSHVLGPVDDNMSEDDEDIEDSESDQDDDGGLSALMAKAGI